MGSYGVLYGEVTAWNHLIPVLAKYAGHAGHVQQSFADVRQRALTLLDILSSRIQYLSLMN